MVTRNDVLEYLRITAYVLMVAVIPWLLAMYKLMKHYKEPYFAARGNLFVFSFMIVSGLYVFVATPLFLFDIFNVYTMILNFSLADFSLWILLIRVFKLFVNIEYSTESVAWKRQIDKNYTNWVLKHYHILNNPYKVFAVTSFLWLFNTLIGVFLVVMNVSFFSVSGEDSSSDVLDQSSYGVILTWLVLIGPIQALKYVVCLWCVKKIKGFDDHWSLAREFKLILINCIGSLVVCCVFIPLIAILVHAIAGLTGVLVACLWNVIMWYIMVPWVINANSDKKNILNKTYGPNVSTSVLIQLIQTAEGYEELVRHMQREFSVEHLLFLTVMWELQSKLLSYGLIDLENNSLIVTKNEQIVMPPNVPMSPIIYRNLNQDRKFSSMLRLDGYAKRRSSRKDRVFSTSSSPRAHSVQTDANVRLNIENININNLDGVVVDAEQSPSPIPTTPSVETINIATGSNTKKIGVMSKFSYDKVFVPVFEEIYKKYVEMHKAPSEINISYPTRCAIQKSYQSIQEAKAMQAQIGEVTTNGIEKEPILDEAGFLKIWEQLGRASKEVFVLVAASHRRLLGKQ